LAAQVVVDSGILIAGVLREPITGKARTRLRQWKRERYQIVAPTLFRYELIAVMRKSVYQGRLTPAEALKGRDFLLEYPVQLHMDGDLLRRAYDLAAQFNRPTAYDSQYLAVAERLGCEFWTADERLFRAVSQDLDWVRWLGDFTG